MKESHSEQRDNSHISPRSRRTTARGEEKKKSMNLIDYLRSKYNIVRVFKNQQTSFGENVKALPWEINNV
jgi:hypothetical protein